MNSLLKTIFGLMLLFGGILPSPAQDLPSVVVKDLDGAPVRTETLRTEGKPFVISFFATWCKPCLRELDAVAEVYEEWQEETGVTIYAVSIDEGADVQKVKPLARAHDWAYTILSDANGDLKRAMNVAMVPSLFVFDGRGELIHRGTGYVDGGESEIIEVIRKHLPQSK